MLSNNSLCLCSMRSALLFLILAVNSYRFQILQSCTLSNLAARSYALLVWLIASEVSNEENLFSEEVI